LSGRVKKEVLWKTDGNSIVHVLRKRRTKIERQVEDKSIEKMVLKAGCKGKREEIPFDCLPFLLSRILYSEEEKS
jgi:hypothetical protein